MHENSMTLRTFCERYRQGDFLSEDRNVQIEAGWFDWVCPDYALPRRLAKLWNILKGITNDYILDNYYVWFVNNRPLTAPIYDSIHLSPPAEWLGTGVYFRIEIDDKRNPKKYMVYVTMKNYFHEERGYDNVRDVRKYFNKWSPDIK